MAGKVPKVATGKEVGGVTGSWKKGRSWVCSVQNTVEARNRSEDCQEHCQILGFCGRKYALRCKMKQRKRCSWKYELL